MLCVGVVLLDSKEEAFNVPEEQRVFERLEPYVSNVTLFLAFSHANNYALSSISHEYM